MGGYHGDSVRGPDWLPEGEVPGTSGKREILETESGSGASRGILGVAVRPGQLLPLWLVAAGAPGQRSLGPSHPAPSPAGRSGRWALGLPEPAEASAQGAQEEQGWKKKGISRRALLKGTFGQSQFRCWAAALPNFNLRTAACDPWTVSLCQDVWLETPNLS